MTRAMGYGLFRIVLATIALAGLACSKPEEDADLLPPPGYVPKPMRSLVDAQGGRVRFGKGWFPMETNADGAWRWMGESGEIKIASTAPGTTLHIRVEGWAPTELLPTPPTLTFRADGKELESFVAPTGHFVKEYDLPTPSQAPHATTSLVIETSRAVEPPGDTRSLGYALVAFALRPANP